jgi:hypothetical protein
MKRRFGPLPTRRDFAVAKAELLVQPAGRRISIALKQEMHSLGSSCKWLVLN